MRINFSSLAFGTVLLVGTALFPLTSAHADVLLFSDNFDTPSNASNWVTNRSGGTDSSFTYGFDYSSIGIGSAPNSGGTTLGGAFLVNQSAGVAQGISASPIGQSFTGDYRVQFNLWINYVGAPSPGNGIGTGGTSTPGGSGSTQFFNAGLGTAGTTGQYTGANLSTGAVSDGIMVAASGDGGSTQDYRAYRGTTLLAPDTSPGTYAAGNSLSPDSRNSAVAYYNTFGNTAAPQAQSSMQTAQSGTTPTGALGFAWRDVTIDKVGNTVTWSIDTKKIATVDITNATLGGSNIFIGMSDPFSGSSTYTYDNLNTAIYDNLRVSSITTAPVPEPGTWAMMSLGCLALGLVGRRRKREAGAELV